MNNITFEQFIKTYNFRYVNESIGDKNDLCNDTCIIRIYPPSDDSYRDKWFEFGIWDFGHKEYTWDKCKQILSEEIINSYVDYIQYNPDYDCGVTVYLTNKKERED